jgi:hypothetical protein
LIVPITKQEKQMFDAIDGRRTIADIADHAGGGDARSCAMGLFEKLWRYDQVVFDTASAQCS